MSPRIILYTGKGGVGKTSVAAATARRCAAAGSRTLVLSTDPAHSLAESLGLPLGNEPVEAGGGAAAGGGGGDRRLADTAQRFTDYKAVPPEVTVTPRRLRGGTSGRVAFELSKISTVVLRITRGTTVVEERPFGAVGYGKRTFGWDVPRRRGAYTVELAVSDLAGNSASARAVVTVLKPKKRS